MRDEERRRVVEDALERCTELARLSRLHGDTAGAEKAEAVAANAAIELAYMDALTPENGWFPLYRRRP